MWGLEQEENGDDSSGGEPSVEADFGNIFENVDISDDIVFNKSTDQPKSFNVGHLMDETLLHTISLLQYKRYISKLNEPSATPESSASSSANSVVILKVPEISKSKPKTDNFSPSEFGQTESYTVLRKVVAVLSAHIGFQDADAEALETLTDIAGMYIERLCKLYNLCELRRQCQMECAFDSSAEQMLHMVGIDDANQLSDYYKNRIQKYHDRLYYESCETRKRLEKANLKK